MLKRFIKKEEGFTLIELLIVIIIIGILMAIGIPAYLTYQSKAKDVQAKNNLNLAWKAARAAGVDIGGNYHPTRTSVQADIVADQPQLAGVLVSSLTSIKSYHCTNGTVNSVYIRTANSTQIRLYVKSNSGKVWALSGTTNGLINNYNSPTYTAVGASC